jgi:uncharacterized membrane protein YgcG
MATPVQQVLTICGATVIEIQYLEIRERMDVIPDFAEMTSRDVVELAKDLGRRNANARLLLPHKLIRNIKALCFWARERTLMNMTLDPDLFTAASLAKAKQDLAMREDTTDAAPPLQMEKFKASDWPRWSRDFVTYLSHHNGVVHAPLDYVVRPDTPPATPTDREALLQRYPLVGDHYKQDNMRVYRILNTLLTGTEATTWIRAFDRAQDGRAAWNALVAHYDGGGQQEKRIARAESTISQLHYKNESVFAFDNFSSQLLDAYRDLDKGGIARTEYEKVKALLPALQVNCSNIEVLKAHVKEHFRRDLQGALDYLSVEFAEIFPAVTFGKRRHISDAHTDHRPNSYQRTGGRGRGRGGRGSGRGGRGGRGGRFDDRSNGGGSYTGSLADEVQVINGVYTFFGVDVSDPSQTFSNDEMDRLGSKGQRYIFDQRRSQQEPRSIAATGTHPGDDMSSVGQHSAPGPITNGTPTAISLPPPPTGIQPPANPTIDQRGSQNGNRFGSGQYQRR